MSRSTKCATNDKQLKMEERGHWDKKVEYILAVAGAIVGLGNVWRFPYLCYKNGGGKKRMFTSLPPKSVLQMRVFFNLGAFLVPYLILAVTCGVPLFLLETTVGQYTQEGSVTCWRKLCPLFEGRTYCIIHTVILIVLYYTRDVRQ